MESKGGSCFWEVEMGEWETTFLYKPHRPVFLFMCMYNFDKYLKTK